MNKNKRLTGLEAKHFMHPGDRIGMERMKQFPKVKKIMGGFLEKDFEKEILSFIRFEPRQEKKLNDMIFEACDILAIKNLPKPFMSSDPIPNANSYGNENVAIVLTSGLIDSFSDEEIFTVISAELGHIKCGHTFYTYAVRKLELPLHIVSMASMGKAIMGTTLERSLPVWYRRAELSADRAALLVTKSTDFTIKTMMKVASGGSDKIFESLSLESFLKKAEEYEKLEKKRMSSGGYKQFIPAKLSSQLWLSLRASEVIKFYNSDRYKRILENDYPEDEEIPEGIYANDIMEKFKEKRQEFWDVIKRTVARKDVGKSSDSI